MSTFEIATAIHCAYQVLEYGAKELITLTVDHPIQKLHPDILAKVFTAFYLSSNKVKRAPILLCNVCSSWRALAISIPILWTELDLDYDRLEDHNIESVICGIHTWLGRSRTLPLTIRLGYNEPMMTVHKFLQVCDALSNYASRWESLELISPDVPFHTWPNLHVLPLLHTLYVRSPITRFPFTSCPRLTRATLSSSEEFTPLAMSGIPWHQLVALRIRGEQTNESIMKTITCCPLLESLDVQIMQGHPLVTEPGRTHNMVVKVKHTALKKVGVFFSDGSCDILEFLVLPALASLSLFDYSLSDPIYATLLGLFNRSHCKLQELCYYGSMQDQLIECLKHSSCQTLTNLHIEDRRLERTLLDDKLFLRLTYVEDMVEEILCPELIALTLLPNSPSISPGLLGRMVASRLKKERNQFKSLHLLQIYDFSVDDEMILKHAKESGLRVCINHKEW